MKIKFVTESHVTGDEKRTVDIARQADLDAANARIEELDDGLTKIEKDLKILEKHLAAIDKSVNGVDTRLREDCRKIFAGLIEESLAPVFAVMERLVKAKGCSDLSVGEKSQKQKNVAKASLVSVKNSNGKKTKESPAKKKTAKRSRNSR